MALATASVRIVGQDDAMACCDFVDFVLTVAVKRSPFDCKL